MVLDLAPPSQVVGDPNQLAVGTLNVDLTNGTLDPEVGREPSCATGRLVHECDIDVIVGVVTDPQAPKEASLLLANQSCIAATRATSATWLSASARLIP